MHVCISEALQLVMTANGHSNEATRKIVSGCVEIIITSTYSFSQQKIAFFSVIM